MARPSGQQRWHFVLPFFYGKNRYVTGRGGAPVDRKLSFLAQTIASIADRFPSSDIIVTVCDEISAEKAGTVNRNIRQLACPPLALPYATVKFAAEQLVEELPADDIIVFNEDDQVLTISEIIVEDICRYGDSHFFSPHRWVRGEGGRRNRRAVRYRHKSVKGTIDNLYPDHPGTPCRLGCSYRVHTNRLSAYAACWATHVATLKTIDFTEYEAKPELICLETASYIILATGIPVLKTDSAVESPGVFLAEHLSGYWYFKRRFSLSRLIRHLRTLRF
ncbi:MAG: hypothetical protein JW863_00125 [Chitinispirillaceae bacterium]|nr:hypothetical protein [Chitinispirillaceae bacterium]